MSLASGEKHKNVWCIFVLNYLWGQDDVSSAPFCLAQDLVVILLCSRLFLARLLAYNSTVVKARIIVLWY